MAEVIAPSAQQAPERPWWKELNGYHYWVFTIASVSWLFDCMDQRFFNIVRQPALESLLAGHVPPEALKAEAQYYGRVATCMILVGWAIGGFFFGMMGDRIGRVRTMMITILIYSGFTGLSALSMRWWDFTIYRFLMGLGVGGLFAAAVSLVAEVMPARARPIALGMFQALSAMGNVLGSAISMGLKPTESVAGVENWRWLFVVGVAPALLVVAIQKTLHEPESWKQARTRASEDLGRQLGAWRDLFAPGLRRNTLVGLTLAVAGVMGLWGVGFFSPELVRLALKDLTPSERDWYVAAGFALQDVGAFFGVFFFTMIAGYLGRRGAFALSFLLAFAATAFTFKYLSAESHVLWMLPILGFANLAVFGGYAIYFPELFPTRLRNSGVGFCYNVGRIVTAVFVLLSAGLLAFLRDNLELKEPFRTGSIIIASVYFVGIVALLWAPETKGRPLPE